MNRMMARLSMGMALLLGALTLGGCVYEPLPPAAYGPAPGYAYGPAYYPAPAYYYYPPVVGSVFIGGHAHFR